LTPAAAPGLGVALIGRFVPAVAFLYDYAWFAGLFFSGGIYYLMMLRHRKQPTTVTD